jgi:hypothetical protein
LTTLYLAPEKPFSNAAEMNALNEQDCGVLHGGLWR